MRYLRDDYLGYLLGFVLFVSCSHEQDKKQRTSSINLRQQYVKTNKFLDVDMSKFLPGTQTQASVTAEIRLRCLWLCIVFIVMWKWWTMPTCVIWQMRRRFRFLKGFSDLYRRICRRRICKFQRLKEQGKKVTISEITPEYLNSLLENKWNQSIWFHLFILSDNLYCC